MGRMWERSINMPTQFFPLYTEANLESGSQCMADFSRLTSVCDTI